MLVKAIMTDNAELVSPGHTFAEQAARKMEELNHRAASGLRGPSGRRQTDRP